MNPEAVYDLESAKLPYLAGTVLRLMAALLESPFRRLLIPSLLQNAGITSLRDHRVDEPPTYYPLYPSGTLTSTPVTIPLDQWSQEPAEPGPGFRFATVHDYARAYRESASKKVVYNRRIDVCWKETLGEPK